MSIPKVTAFIGESVTEKNKNEFSSIIKNVKKIKENEEPYVVFLVLDLSKEEIYFQLDKKLNQNSIYEYYYFGNNPGAAAQCYLAREVKSIKYLLTNTFGDLYRTLFKCDMEESELGVLLKKLEESNLVYLGKKKGEGKLNFSKFSILSEGKISKIELDEKKNINADDKRYNPESFIRLFIEDDNKNNKFVLVVPKVILEDKNEIVLSTHIDYLEVVKKINNLGICDKEDDKKGRNVCYICKKEKSNVLTEYTTSFARTGINKIFTTTTVNNSQYFKKYNQANNYYMCKECYQKLLSGEKIISKEFKSKIAGEDVFIVPESLMKEFNYNTLNILKKDIDLAFKKDDAEIWLQTINMMQNKDNIGLYTVSLIFYRTDGNSVTVLETIEDVPTLRFEEVMHILNYYTESLEPHTKKVSLASIYRFIPVKINKKNKEQIDIGRVLSLYKAILSGEQINANVLYSYAVEALEKGLKQLGKSKIDNYINMGLKGYLGYEDFYIKRIVFAYIVLIKTCQELNILDKEVFKKYNEGGEALNIINTPSDEINSFIMQIEGFLDEQEFSNDSRALFYLGILVNRVAVAQFHKEHKTKPILKKIQFQGMNEKDIYRLYEDTVEKLIQYNKMTLFSEAIINRFHYYFGALDNNWSLNDQANVFYIMAGYSYMVGNKSPDLSKEEMEAQKQPIKEDGDNENLYKN